MTGFAIFGTLLVILLTAIIRAAVRAGEDTGAALRADERRDAAIEALRELELEYRTGKVTEDEYEALRARLEGEAVAARNAAGAPDCAHCGETLLGRESFCPACGVAVSTTA